MRRYQVVTYLRDEGIARTAKAYEMTVAKAIARHRNHVAKVNHKPYISYEIEPETVVKGWKIR